MTSHRTRTRSKTRSWQLGAVLLAGGAAALGFLPLAKYFGAGTYSHPVTPETGEKITRAIEPMEAEELARLAKRMRDGAGKIEVVQAIPDDHGAVPPDVDPVPAPTPPPPPPSTWVYKSYLGSPRLKAAAIVVNEQQMLVCEGRAYDSEKHTEVAADTAGAIKVVEVRPTHLTVEENGATRQIDIAARVSNGFPTEASAGRRPPPAMAAGNRPGMNGQPNMPFNPNQNPNNTQPGMARMGMNMASPMPNNPNYADQMKHGMPGPSADEMSSLVKERLEGLSQEKRDMLAKTLSDQSLDPTERWKLLEETGISPKTSPEERVQLLRSLGVTSESDPKLYEHVKSGGGGGK